jgi:acyl-CoA synthetase (NDP forming)
MARQTVPEPVGDIDRLLRPKSVAIVGASEKPGALGNSVLINLERLGYAGDIYLVNPKREEIGGRPCVRSPADLPMGVDAAVLAIPRAFVLDTIRTLAERKCGSVVIFAAGFAEAGEEGREEQRQIGEIARKAGMIIEGPNCLGCVNFVDRIGLTFVEAPTPLLEGRKGIAIVSQSGAMAAVLASNLTDRCVGLSYSVSTGNEAASGVEDYVAYMIEDPHTSVIAMIVEQFRKPALFLELARRARKAGKPVILLHPGRSEAAAASAATHTGAMAGDYRLVLTKVERAGVIVVNSLEELGDVAEIAARYRARPDRGCVMLTESGAFKALTLDLCDEIGLDLPVLTEANAPALRAAMPEFVAVSNPVDMTAQALVDPDMYRRVLEAVVGDDRFGSVVLAIIQTDDSTTEKKFPPIIRALGGLQTDKPVIITGVDEGGIVRDAYVTGVRAQGCAYFPSSDRAMRAIAHLTAWSKRDFTVSRMDLLTPGILPAAGVIPEYQAKAFLGPLGVPFPKSSLARSKSEAALIATELGYPVVLKAQSPELSHKSDAGGVLIGLKSSAAVRRGWSEMTAKVGAYRPGLKLDGILVEAMGARGVELIIGGKNEPGWGPVVLAGFGGVQAEIYQDVRLLAPDLTKAAIVDELLKLKGARLLTGFRGTKPVDFEAVAQIISIVGRLLLQMPSIREIDLNPVVVFEKGKGAVALDALMSVSGEEQ